MRNKAHAISALRIKLWSSY